jgi:hypothetical protein
MNDAAPSDRRAGIWNFHEHDSRRSLILCGTGAVLGLVVAGLGLFTADGTRTSQVAPQNAATVNGVPVLMSDFAVQVKALYDVPLSQATPAQKRKALDDMIREELYVQRGVELSMQTDITEVRQALVLAVEAQASLDARMAQPGEKELQDYYAANRARYADEGTMTLDEYLLPVSDAARAPAVVAALRRGEAPATLGLKRSARMTDGEAFYFAAKIHLGDALFDVARRLKSSEVSDAVRQGDALHILVMRANRTPPPPPFKQVRPQVLKDFVDAQAATLTAGNERFLRKRADIQFQDGLK